jgi:transposase-like protein
MPLPPPFPQSLPEFQRLFPDDDACSAYLERCRWEEGFVCPRCGWTAEPIRISTRPGVLRCRKCRKQSRVTVGTIMEGSHTRLITWFWAAYLVSSQTPGMSARQFQRQLGISCYETAFQILHKLRAGMVRPDQDRIGGRPGEHIEVDETLVGGRTRGRGRGVHRKVTVVGAVEVRWSGKGSHKRRGGRYAGRVRLCVADRTADTLGNFVEAAVMPGSVVVTDGWQGYDLEKAGYKHLPVTVSGKAHVVELYLPIIHLVFSNLKTWLRGTHHGVSPQHLQAYLNEFVFRFNRRFQPLDAFRSLMGIAGGATAPTYDALYSGLWQHPRTLDNVPF